MKSAETIEKFEIIPNILIEQDKHRGFNEWLVATYLFLRDNMNHRYAITTSPMEIYEYYGYQYDRHRKENLYPIMRALYQFCNTDILSYRMTIDTDYKHYETVKPRDKVLVEMKDRMVDGGFFTMLPYEEYYRLLEMARGDEMDSCTLLNVYCFILRHFDMGKNSWQRYCSCSLNTFSDKLQISKPTVRRYTEYLADQHMIVIRSGNRQHSNRYFRYKDVA